MATVTESIGTTGRDHSTITLWEANLDDDPTYDSGDIAIGECYDDSDFDEAVTLDGGTTIGLTEIILTVASGERHDGTATTGATISYSGSSNEILLIPEGAVTPVTVSWLVITNTSSTTRDAVKILEQGIVANVIVHDVAGNNNSAGLSSAAATSEFAYFLNCIVYDITTSATNRFCIGIRTIGQQDTKIYNCTIHNIQGTSSTIIHGIAYKDDADWIVKNCIVTDTNNAGAGAGTDYQVASPSSADVDFNIASDTTASGANSHDSETASNLFVSTTGGSEDLHLKSGATNAIDGGLDLNTTPSGVEIDIDGVDRNVIDSWDIGCHDFIAAAGGGPAVGSLLLMGVGK